MYRLYPIFNLDHLHVAKTELFGLLPSIFNPILSKPGFWRRARCPASKNGLWQNRIENCDQQAVFFCPGAVPEPHGGRPERDW